MLHCYGIGMGELIPIAHPYNGSIQFSSHLLPIAHNLEKYDPMSVPYHHPTLPYDFRTFALVRDFIPI